MLKRIRINKIGTKISCVVILLMVITLVALGIISFNSASNSLFTSYESSLTTEASQTAQIVANGIQLVKADMQKVGYEIGRVVDDKTSIQAVLNGKQQELGYKYMRYTGIDGTNVSVDSSDNDLSGDASFNKAISGETVLNRPAVYKVDGQLYFYGFTPVKDLKNNVQGVLTMMVPYDNLYGIIKNVKIGKTGYVIMLDENGGTAMHSNIDKVIKKENILELVKSDSSLTALAGIMQKCINQDTGFQQYIYKNVVKYTSFAPVPGTTWSVMLSVPKSELFTQIDQFMYIVIITSAASLIIMLSVLILFIKARVSKPLKETADFAKELASGNLEAKITAKSQDEVGQLVSILDNKVRDAFMTVKKNALVLEKQSRYQSEHADKLIVNLERLSSGELYCDMTADEPDEDTGDLYELFGRISDNLHLTVNTLKTYIEEISETLSAMSSGDLSVSLENEYRGEFIALKDSINGIIASFNATMLEINTAADQVSAGARQVSDGNQAISQGATEQASSIEELTATITQIAQQTKQNAMSANKANELTVSAVSDAAQGNEQMKAMQQSMDDISESSQNIGKIIKVIDDIAFQTNILALNAAVEAARAGVHGKGFAVVAEEVRNLAARSANAAKETTDLIEGSIRKTETGTKIAKETAGALTSIVEGVDKAAQLVSEIARASNEQAGAITQVNNGIEQMSQVVQTNSATAEEGAAASEELSSQAEMLKNMVGKFSLKAGTEQLKKSEPVKAAKAQYAGEKSKTPVIKMNDADFGKY